MEISNSQTSLFDQTKQGYQPVEYHNSINLNKDEVEDWRKVVVGQNAKVLEFFANHPHVDFCGWEASDATGVFITDTRRAINYLQKEGWLKQVGEKVAKKGHLNYTYSFVNKRN